VSFGCTGGQHRSVYLAEQLAKHLRGRSGVEVSVRHRELDRMESQKPEEQVQPETVGPEIIRQ